MSVTTTSAASSDRAALAEANRKRYDALKAAGQSSARPLPPLSDRDAAAVEAARVVRRETIPGGWHWTTQLQRGQALRLLNPQATPGVSVMLWNAADPAERYNAADTVKLQWTAELRRGRVLFSDMGRVLASLTEDSCGTHDTLMGGSTARSNLTRYGSTGADGGLRNTRDNLRLAAGKLGLSRRDLAPCVTFFAPVRTDQGGRFVWHDGRLQPGDFVELRAEMNLLVALSNCPHPLAPGSTFAPADIEAVIWQAPSPAPDDPCRSLTEEARRGFDNTDVQFASPTITG